LSRCKKNFRSHRAAIDFDKGFIHASLKTEKYFDFKEAVKMVTRRKQRERKRKKRATQNKLTIALFGLGLAWPQAMPSAQQMVGCCVETNPIFPTTEPTHLLVPPPYFRKDKHVRATPMAIE